MHDVTRASLLQRVRNAEDESSWQEFYDLYAPMVLAYARARGLDPDSAEEVMQECMASLARRMKTFEYSPEKGHFKGWVRTMVNRQVVSFIRKRREVHADTARLNLLEDTHPSVSDAWDHAWHTQRLRYCLERVREQVDSHTYQAFTHYVLDEWPVEKVAKDLEMNTNQVYLAKSRITKMLKSRMLELLGDEE